MCFEGVCSACTDILEADSRRLLMVPFGSLSASPIYSERRPNQYMQGFLVRAVGRARESDRAPAENLRSPSRPPAERASPYPRIGAYAASSTDACLPASAITGPDVTSIGPSRNFFKFFTFLRDELSLSFFGPTRKKI